MRKEDFIYTLLESEIFTLDRKEISNIASLMLNISERNDKGWIDLEELQNSYNTYISRQLLIEARIVDLFEKFKLCIIKKCTELDQFEALAADIQARAVDSKINITDLKSILEDQYGIVIRYGLYDQLASYFDLDRDGTIYIGSFCEYIYDPTLRKFNFHKVNPGVMTTQICDYIRDCIANHPSINQQS